MKAKILGLILAAAGICLAATLPPAKPVHSNIGDTDLLGYIADNTQRLATGSGVATLPPARPVHANIGEKDLLAYIADYTQDLLGKFSSTTGTFNNVVLVPGTTPYAATTTLDFAGNSLTTVSLTGNVTFATTNLIGGRSMTVRIICDATLRNMSFPGWVFVGAAAPSSIAAGKTGILTLTAFGLGNPAVVAAYSVQP